MGDRTTSNLYLYGDLKKASAAQLAELIQAINDADPETYGEGTPSEKLAAENGHFWFYEVNYGEMDSDLEEAIINAGLSYVWSWDAGGGYPSGMKLHNAETDETAEFATCDSEICLGISELTSENIAEARRWHNWHGKSQLAA